jgi:hypothetical protein
MDRVVTEVLRVPEAPSITSLEKLDSTDCVTFFFIIMASENAAQGGGQYPQVISSGVSTKIVAAQVTR